jgi:hypothetical protein
MDQLTYFGSNKYQTGSVMGLIGIPVPGLSIPSLWNIERERQDPRAQVEAGMRA